jgi:predicted aldo/keto reductase-like oxidoreductase
MVLNLKLIVKRLGKNTLLNPEQSELLEKARLCNECGECVEKCPYQLPIPELIKENIEWVEKQLKS